MEVREEKEKNGRRMRKYILKNEPREFPKTLEKAFPQEKTHIARLRLLDETLREIVYGYKKPKK